MKTAIVANLEQPSKSMAIVQLNRAGDLLQTYQAALEVKRYSSHIKLVLIARKNFSTSLRFLLSTVFDEIIEIDRQDLFQKHNDLTSLKIGITNIIQAISKIQINVLINLSFCKTSSFLCSLISAEHKLGPYRDNYANLLINDKWSQYIYSVVMTDSFNPFNLVDLFCFVLGVKSSKNLTPNKKEIKQNYNLLIHPFASHPKKMWKMEKWSEIIFQLLKENPHVQISIVGSDHEAVAAEQILKTPILERYLTRINNYVGELNLEGVFSLLKNSHLFIGHDSMIGHLAAIANIQCLTISAGSVRSEETTPYGDGNYNLIPTTKCFPCYPQDPCPQYECHSDIPISIISYCVHQLISYQSIESDQLLKNLSAFHLNSVTIKKSTFSEANLLKLVDLIPKNFNLKNIIKVFYRIGFLYFNASCDENTDFPRLSELGHQELLETMEGLKHLYELFNFGKKYSQYVLEELARDIPNIASLHELSGKIDEISYLLDLVKQTNPVLSPIINLNKLAQGNLAGKNIVEITENSYLTYHDYTILVQAIYELAENTIIEHKSKTRSLISKKDLPA